MREETLMAFFKDSHGPVRIKLRYFGDLRRARDAHKLKRRIEIGRTRGCIQIQERIELAPEAEVPRGL